MTEKELQKIQTLHESYGSHIDRGDGICGECLMPTKHTSYSEYLAKIYDSPHLLYIIKQIDNRLAASGRTLEGCLDITFNIYDKTKRAIWHKNRLFVLEAIYDQYTDEVEIRINSQYIIRKPRNKMSIIYAAIKTGCESVCWDKGIDLSPIL